MARHGPLQGLKVLELGQLVAGPFATRLMAEFGAEVIKVEPPGIGDPLRNWRVMAGDTSLWWYLQGRNKKSITVDLRKPEGQEIVRRLAAKVDILVENFRPGAMERWGLGWEQLQPLNPRLIMVRISGYGQDGPDRDKPGFGAIGEAMGGIRHITGYPDRPPVRVGLSLGDSLAGLYGALGALMAVYHRDVAGSGRGQVVDTALYEAVFGVTESLLPEFDRTGQARSRTGNQLPGIAPTSTYTCADGQHVVIGANGDSIFRRFMSTIGRPDLAEDPRFQTNAGRAAHAEFLDSVIDGWTRQHTLEEVLALCEQAGTPAGRIYSAADMVRDPQYIAREMIRTVQLPDGPLRMPGIVPKLSETPGEIDWVGPRLGEHTDEILTDLLGLHPDELAALRANRVI
ncbi:MAG: CaiB/BaiF CoA transferase family protein [Bacillota bacterium]